MLPSGIQQTAEQCLAAMRADPLHHLERGYRLAMHSALGAADPHRAPGTNLYPESLEGCLRRCYLRILAAQFVLPFWERQFPNDNTPQQILAECYQLMREAEQGSVSDERLRYYIQMYPDDADDVFRHYSDQDVIPVAGTSRYEWLYLVASGEVAKDVLHGVASDVLHFQGGAAHVEKYRLPVEVNFPLKDEDTDYNHFGSDFFCAQAYCGVVTTPFDESTPERVRLICERNGTFWHWWLTDAVAQAYAFRPSP